MEARCYVTQRYCHGSQVRQDAKALSWRRFGAFTNDMDLYPSEQIRPLGRFNEALYHCSLHLASVTPPRQRIIPDICNVSPGNDTDNITPV